MNKCSSLSRVAATFVASPLLAQQTVPPAAPTIGASAGGGGGIAIPDRPLEPISTRRGYTVVRARRFLGRDQPYSFRAELSSQHYDRKNSAPAGTDSKNVVVARRDRCSRGVPRPRRAPTSIGGIGVYRSTDEGTKPGVNRGGGARGAAHVLHRHRRRPRALGALRGPAGADDTDHARRAVLDAKCGGAARGSRRRLPHRNSHL